MSFVLRTTSIAVTGREIVRLTRINGDTLTIGRDVASDLVLPDLLLALDHARLHRIDGTRVEVRAVAGLPFEVDGTSSQHAVIDLLRGGEILLGAHRLTLARDAAGDVLVEVSRTGDLSHSASTKDERALFSLRRVMLAKRPFAWGLLLLILGLFLVWPVWAFYHRDPPTVTATASPHAAMSADASWSPGKLSAAHAELETNCKACHTQAFVAVRDDSCRSCHTNVHDHADPARLAAALPALDLGGELRRKVSLAFNRPPGRCVDCHTEHQGSVAMAPTPQRFCSDCHATMKTRLPDSAFGNAGDFATAHPQFRPAITVRGGAAPVVRRISLDLNPRQDSGLTFPHKLHLSGTNAVAQMARRQGQVAPGGRLDCAGCHVPDVQGGFKPVSMEANCQSCHSLAFARSDGTVRTLRHGDPAQVVAELRDFYALHGPTQPASLGGSGRRRPGDFAAASMAATYGRAVATRGLSAERAIRAVFSPGGACYDCHKVEAPTTPGRLDFRIAPVAQQTRYLAHGWFDHRAHTTETCASCHAAPRSNDARDVLLPKIAQCRTCHAGADPARGQIKSTCAMCHVYHQDKGGVTIAATRADASSPTTRPIAAADRLDHWSASPVRGRFGQAGATGGD